MDEPRRAFEVVSDNDVPAAAPAPSKAATGLLVIALKALSQRALAAVTDLFTLLTVASAFWVWCSVNDPNVLQIIHHSIYGVFVLAANWIVRRK
jgi:hypothetical protein